MGGLGGDDPIGESENFVHVTLAEQIPRYDRCKSDRNLADKKLALCKPSATHGGCGRRTQCRLGWRFGAREGLCLTALCPIVVIYGKHNTISVILSW